MTLEEIIKHCENVADYDCFNDDQRKCSEEHRRIAEWLKEIKETETGEWIVLDECRNAGVYCSNCNKKIFKLDFSNTMKWKDFKYCPHCGKEMDGRRYMNVKPMKCSEIPNNSDYISREAALKKLDRMWLCDLPPIQPEHRTGNWQDRRIIATNGNSLGIFRCSECKRASTITTAFCPNCGADMRGKQDEDID